MRKGDLGAGAILLVVAVYVWIEAGNFLPGRFPMSGPSFWPRVLAVVLAGLSLIMMAGAYLAGRKGVSDASNSIPPFSRRSFFGLVVMVAYVYLYRPLGFFVTTFLFFGTLMWYLQEKKNYLQLTVTSAGVTLLIYVLFGRFLSVLLPKGIFWPF